MPDFDDEEYEAFDLDETGARRTTGQPASGSDGAPKTDESSVRDPDVDDVGEHVLDEDDEDDDEEDELEDAADDEIDFVIAAYREDGQPLVQALNNDLANDLEELVVQLRRLPGDAGALGFVSLVEEVFVIVRVRGQHVQVLLSDAAAAADWPIARDVADFLGAEIPDSEDDDEPMGDMGLLADMGLRDFDLGAIIDNLELSSDQMLTQIAEKIKIGTQFQKVAEAAFRA